MPRLARSKQAARVPSKATLSAVLAILALLLVEGCAPQNIGRYNQGYNRIAFGTPLRHQNEIIDTHDDWYKSFRYYVQNEEAGESVIPGPTDEDLKPPAGDYVLGPGDIINLTVQDLIVYGQPDLRQLRVSEEGSISMPYLGNVKASGLTSRGLEQKLTEMLRSLIKEPRVSVFVSQSANRSYTIITGVRTPNIYPLVMPNQRLAACIAQAGGLSPFTERWGYISRDFTSDEMADLWLRAWSLESQGTQPAADGASPAAPPAEAAVPAATPPAATAVETPAATPVEPSAPDLASATPAAPAAAVIEVPATPVPAAAPKSTRNGQAVPAEMVKELEEMARGEKSTVKESPAADSATAAATAEAPKKIESPATPTTAEVPTTAAPESPAAATAPRIQGPEFEFKDGMWVPKGGAAAAAPATAPTTGPTATAAAPGAAAAPSTTTIANGKEPPAGPVRLAELPDVVRNYFKRHGVRQAGQGLKRIMRIDIPAAMALDASQNPVIRNNDEIVIPEPPAGEWYIDGEVVRRGVYSLTGRKITLLQAVSAAGGLTQLAIPKRTELVRRVGEHAEEIIYVDLDKIARGEAPDFFLQPHDRIMVGTDQGAIFMAVLRNAFRGTYGFGTVYDQNFADIYPFKGAIHPLF